MRWVRGVRPAMSWVLLVGICGTGGGPPASSSSAQRTTPNLTKHRPAAPAAASVRFSGLFTILPSWRPGIAPRNTHRPHLTAECDVRLRTSAADDFSDGGTRITVQGSVRGDQRAPARTPVSAPTKAPAATPANRSHVSTTVSEFRATDSMPWSTWEGLPDRNSEPKSCPHAASAKAVESVFAQCVEHREDPVHLSAVRCQRPDGLSDLDPGGRGSQGYGIWTRCPDPSTLGLTVAIDATAHGAPCCWACPVHLCDCGLHICSLPQPTFRHLNAGKRFFGLISP